MSLRGIDSDLEVPSVPSCDGNYEFASDVGTEPLSVDAKSSLKNAFLAGDIKSLGISFSI